MPLGRTLSLNAAVAALLAAGALAAPRAGGHASAAARCSRARSRPTCASTASRSLPGSDAIVALDRARRGPAPRLRLGHVRGPADRDPVRRRRRRTARERVRFAYADESDRVRYPIPRGVHIEGGRDADGDRHALLVDRGACRLYELFDLQGRPGAWSAGSGATWNLRSNAAAPRRLDVRRRRRPADPAAARPPRRGPARPDRPRAARHGPPLAARVRLPRAPLRLVSDADPSLPRMGERLRLKAGVDVSRPPAPGARRREGAEALRADRRRQRLGLVRLRRAAPALGQRPAARARRPHRPRLRGRRHAPAAALTRQASRTWTRPPSPTASVRRPASSSSSSAPTSSRRQPLQRAHVGLGRAAAGGDDDRREVGARGDQLVGEPGLLRAAAHERLGERDHRPVDGLRLQPVAVVEVHGLGLLAARDRLEHGGPAAAHDVRVDAADLGQLAPARRAGAWRARRPSGRAGPSRPGRSSSAAVRSRQAASSRATARSRASSPLTRGSRRQTSPGSRSSVASAIARHSSRAHSSRPRASSRVAISSRSASRCSTSPRA